MRTRSSKSAKTPSVHDLSNAPMSASSSVSDRMSTRWLLERTKVRLRAARGSLGGARRDAGSVIDPRAMERAQAQLGCAVRGIRPPGSW